MNDNDSYLINYFKQISGITQGRQKDFWDWKVENAKLLNHVKTDDIRKQYPEIDSYLKRNKTSVNLKECYRNAGKLCMGVEGVNYVEGEISYHGVPIEHAWNSINGQYFDITKDILFSTNSDYSEYVKIIELNRKDYLSFLTKYENWGGFVREKFISDTHIKESFFPRLMEYSVADEYYQKRLGISNNQLKMDRIDNNRYNIVATIDDVPIIKNPISLKPFDKSVRAIVDKNGNIYIAAFDGTFNHGMMGNILHKRHIIKTGIYNENNEYLSANSLGIYDDQKNFLLLNRLEDTHIFIQSDVFIHEGISTEEMIFALKMRNPQFSVRLKNNV